MNNALHAKTFLRLRISELENECDQLKDQLQWSLRNEEKYKAALDDSFKREQALRTAVEKLADALAFYAGLIPHAESIGLGEPNQEMGLMPAKFGTVLTKALAEYRAQFPKEKK